MDYFDEALACTRAYLEKYPDSPTAINLEAACLYRIVSPRAADQCLRKLKNFAESDLSFAKDLILHNTVVFRNGETALQILPALVDVVPEARKNMIIYYLKKRNCSPVINCQKGDNFRWCRSCILTCWRADKQDTNRVLAESTGLCYAWIREKARAQYCQSSSVLQSCSRFERWRK